MTVTGFRIWSSFPNVYDTVAAVICASAELMDFTDHDLRVLDCTNGLALAFGHPARGMCLWFTRQSPTPVDSVSAVPVVSATIPWSVDVPLFDVDDEEVSSFTPAVDAIGLPVRESGTLEPLASLAPERLVLVSEPSVTDVPLLNALRAQSMPSAARKQIL